MRESICPLHGSRSRECPTMAELAVLDVTGEDRFPERVGSAASRLGRGVDR